MSETIERPNNSASFAEKAKWAILAALKKAGAKGLFFSELKSVVQEEFPDESIYGDSGKTTSNIAAAVNYLKRTGDLSKVPSSEMSEEDRSKKRTKWILLGEIAEEPKREDKQEPSPDRLRELDLYSPTVMAAQGKGICTFATEVGGALSGWEYGTPDVVGILRPDALVRPLNLPSEIVAIEVKLGVERHSLNTGCAQAALYKQFAHQSYLVVHSQEGEIPAWVQKACASSGIGLCALNLGEDEPTLRCIVEAPSNTPGLRLLSDFIRKLPSGKRGDLRVD